MLTKKLSDGIVVESYELTEHQFERACQLFGTEHMRSEFDSLEQSDQYLGFWLAEDSPFESEKLEWLRGCVDSCAEIYTYKEGWQQIGEIAVRK